MRLIFPPRVIEVSYNCIAIAVTVCTSMFHYKSFYSETYHHVSALLFTKLKIIYCVEGNFGRGNREFGESSVIRQTKTIQISTYH